MRKLLCYSILLFCLLIGSCKCHKESKIEVIEPVESDQQIAGLNNIFLQDTTEQFEKFAGAPTLWQSFETFFKNCVRSSGTPGNALFSRYKLLYLGPTNPRYLGTIYSKNGVETKTELTQWIPEADLEKLIIKGVPVSSCDISEIKSVFIDLMLGKVPVIGTDTTLAFTLKNMDTITNSVGSWSIDQIKTSDFIKYLNDSIAKPDIKYYRDVLLKDDNVVAFQVVKITGFSADINLSRNLNASLDINVPIMSAKLPFSVSFKKTSEKVVHVSSEGEFYAFALVMKGKKID